MRKLIAAIFMFAGATLLIFTLLLAYPRTLSAQSGGQQTIEQATITNTLFLPIIANLYPNFQFSGGPLYRADVISDVWYLQADNQITPGSNITDDFPFDPELDANSLAAKNGALFALAQDGLYKRAAITESWTQISDIDGYFLSAGVGELWYTPLDHPDQVWVSHDEIAWVAKSDGLSGTVISPVLSDPNLNAGYFVVTELGAHDVLWHANDASGTFEWQQVAEVPGVAVDHGKGLFSRVVDASNDLGVGVMLGGGDGKLYEYRFYNSIVPTSTVSDGWVAVWDFGAGNFALPLVNTLGASPVNEVSVINQNSGAITLYQGIIIEEGTIPKRKWQIKP